jgi:hypothetical protein
MLGLELVKDRSTKVGSLQIRLPHNSLYIFKSTFFCSVVLCWRDAVCS